jgi:streptogramin lyase
MGRIVLVVVASILFVACSSPDARRAATSPRNDDARTQERSGTEVLVAVVEESAGRVTLLSERSAPERCDREQLVPGCWFGPLGRSRSYRVPSGPHNAAGHGSVVLVTHPSGGRLTRIDVDTGEVRSVALGTEPHDVKFSRDGKTAIVADEDGRRLHFVDPETLETTSSISMPGRAHDLIVDGDDLWVTLVGRSELARVRGSEIELFPTGMSPHDLVMDADRRIWFSNWDSPVLGTFDPTTSQTTRAPSGVDEPHHFALGPDGTVWVSDNGDSTVVGFRPDGDVTRVEVGPVPHHLAFAGDRLVVAVSEAGEAAVVEGDRVEGRIRLSPGLHGVAIAQRSS